MVIYGKNLISQENDFRNLKEIKTQVKELEKIKLNKNMERMNKLRKDCIYLNKVVLVKNVNEKAYQIPLKAHIK